MALSKYHNIAGATAQDNELMGIGDLPSRGVKSIHITNTHAYAAATVSLYLYKDSTDTTSEEFYYILHDVVIPYSVSLALDNSDILNFDNTSATGYSLHIEVGSSDTVDVIISA